MQKAKRSRKIAYSLILLLFFFSFNPVYALDNQKLLTLNPLVSERFGGMAEDSRSAINKFAFANAGVGLASLALALSEKESEAKLEYTTLAAAGITTSLIFYFNLFPGKIDTLNQKIKLSEAGLERELLAYDSLKELAEGSKSSRIWSCPLSILIGAALASNANSYVSSAKYAWIGLGALIGILGTYSAFVPSRAEVEFDAVEKELDEIE